MSANWVFIDGAGTSKTMSATEISSGIYANSVRVCDATAANFQPTMDAAARPGFVKVTDGTGTLGFDNSNTTAKVSLYGKVSAAGDTALPAFNTAAHAGYVVVTDLTNTMPTMDAVGRAGYVFVTNGTQTMPTMDAAGRKGWVQPTDGTNDFKSASAANLALTASTNAQLVSAPGQWIATSAPGTGATASASQASAGASKRNVCNALSITLAGDATGAAFTGVVNLRDGATGAGTVLATWNLSIPAGAYAIGQQVQLSGLSIPGSVATAMTCEFGSNTAHALQSITLIGTTSA